MTLFFDSIADTYNIDRTSLVYEYISLKTKAHDKGSKARRSLGNLYALYVVCEDFLKGNDKGSSFTYLMNNMRKMPFGSKLQNHPLDNRLNGEVERKLGATEKFLPVQNAIIDGAKARKVSLDFLSHGGNNQENAANFIIDTINEYISIIENQQNEYLIEVEEAKSTSEIYTIIKKAFKYESDARLFEIVSHAILYVFYKGKYAYVGENPDNLKYTPLTLYKTGRTNANDGGIDFVLQPYGRFYQVTETLEFKKYFLDLDKMNKFPITFVIKTGLSKEDVIEKIESDAMKIMNKELVNKYLSLFEEIITLNELESALNEISQSEQLMDLKETVISNYKLEYGMLD